LDNELTCPKNESDVTRLTRFNSIPYSLPLVRIDRFPEIFLFQLTGKKSESLRSHFATLKSGRGKHRKYSPYAFTEQGVAMLSSVLNSDRSIEVNVQIMRAFVKLREMLSTHKDLARKLADMEKKYDSQFKVVFDAIRQLMLPDVPKKGKIGFRREKDA
jgi:hypothetical protein